jgi:tRNA pseudouridine38-40 synthase
MARYQLTLAYDGTDFFGSQRQASTGPSPGTKKRTVQGELEGALRSLGWTGRSILLSGRTDTGVHATGQVAAADLDWSHAEGDLVRALNANLPQDTAVWGARVVRDDFHPRFDAVSRTYRYKLFCKPMRDPIRERFAWRIPSALNGELLELAAQVFPGMHDFRAFGSPTTPKGTTVRTVMKAGWTRAGQGEWQFEVEADAFLYRMVRRMVFVQVSVAQGKISVEDVAHSLAKPGSGGRRSGLAPAHGLTLVAVRYQESGM